MLRKPGFASIAAAVLSIAFCLQTAHAQTVQSGRHTRVLITQKIDEGKLVTLRGNMRPEANAANDRGLVPGNFPMEHMLLQLQRPPELETALQQFIDELHNPASPNFHKWLTARQFGENFGLAQQDLDTIARWLESHGFTVNAVYPSGVLIDFSGTAAQVRAAFHTEIHHLEVAGVRHIANVREPQIPAALAPAISGIVSLHDFRPNAMHKMRKRKPDFTVADPFGGNTYAVVPADLATIYNLNPLFNAGVSGQGQTIVLIEDTDVFSASDWSTFRSTLGLSGYTSASFTSVHPAPSSGANNCLPPGVFAPNDAEAILDAEWASAAAPSAAMEMASCADTTVTFGGLIALENLINSSSNPPAIMSISYGQCETVNGATANAAYNSAYQQAVTEGVSVFVAAGDSGAAGCDNSVSEATQGIAVNAFASTPYNVAVGGTDFSDTFSGSNTTYWNSANTSAFGSAISYIPEIPWNDSCAGALLSSYLGYSPTYGSTSLCNDSLFGPFFSTTAAGGGGPSGCATGAPSINGVVSGTCQGWPKPSWQSVLGNPNDAVRDTPDVSLFAADGLWSHFYVFCWSDTKNGGAACGGDPSTWSGAGGTSFAAPIMAGIQALVNQKIGAPQGNPNPVYYRLAASEYGSAGNSACNSSLGNAVAGSCIFYDVTQGDMDVDCTGTNNCYLPSGREGVLSTSNNSFSAAYGTTTGWDFATGIGSVNAANLVNNWPSSTSAPNFTLSAAPGSLTITQGSSGPVTITVSPQNGFTGSVNLSASALPSGVSAAFSPNPTANTSTLTLTASAAAAPGTVTVTVTGVSGGLTNTTTITLAVNPVGNYTLSASPNSVSIFQGAAGASTITVTPQSGFSSSVSLSASGLPSGVAASFSPNPATSTSTLTLTASSTATPGTVTLTITGMSGGLTNTAAITLTVVQPSADLIISALSAPSTAGAGMTLTITDTTKNQGTGAAGASTTGFYLTASTTLDANAVLFGSRAVPALAAGATSSASTTVTIPAGTTAGNYYIIAKADANNVVPETNEANNLYYWYIQVGPDLVISALSAPSTSGAGMTFTITDTTKNQGAGTAGASTTGFYLSASTVLDANAVLLGSRSVPALAAGATSSGSTTVTIPAGTATGNYYIIAKADANNVVAETNKGNNLYYWYIPVGPDLVISTLSAPSTGGAGLTFTITDTTKNQGGGAADASTTGFYLSASTVLDASAVLLGSRAVPALAAGATSSGSTTATIPAGTATGNYYIIAKADANNVVAETNKGNNLYYWYIQIGPDLVISTLSAPSTAGSTFTITDTTKNQGGGTAGPTTTRFYLSASTVLDASAAVLGSRAIPTLAPGTASSGSTAVTLPAGTAAGNYYIIAKADADNVVAETNEANNLYYWYIQVGPDLVISALSVPSASGAGMTFAITDTTKNQGAGAAGASSTGFYLSASTVLDASAVLLGSRAVPALAAGATSSGSTSVTISAGTATGNYYIIAKADANNAVAETNKANNLYYWYIQIGPDLVISTLSAPSTGGAGLTFTITDTTRNQGGGAADPTTTRFYLSASTVLDASAAVLGSRAIPALVPGATSSGSTTVTIPAGTATGNYYIIAKADADNVVAETNKGNNVYYWYIQVGPDLVISTLSAPSTAAVGATVTITDTTKNQGGGAADPTTTRFYLTARTVLDASAAVLGSRAIPALAAGATSSGSTTVTIPAGTPAGNYYIIAKADADSVVTETNEGNNLYYWFIQITVN